MLSVPVIQGLVFVLMVIGVGLAWKMYAASPVGAPAKGFAAAVARNDFFQDDVNDVLLVNPGNGLVRATELTDLGAADGAVRGLTSVVGHASRGLRRLQNGFVRSYALTMLLGIVVLLGAVWVVQ